MDFFTILIILGIILAFMTYFGIQESQRNSDKRKELDEDIDKLTNELIRSKKSSSRALKTPKIKEVMPEPIPVPEYVVLSKMKNELTPQEYQELENQYNQLLYKRGAEPFNQSLKENSRIFIAYDKATGIPVGQAAILILDTHDFWGAFSKIRNLNLDAQSVILYNVCVTPEHRRRGVAERIMQHMQAWCFANNKPNIVLFVDPNNQSAIRLYERMGYSVDKSHYAPNGAEIMMRTKLH